MIRIKKLVSVSVAAAISTFAGMTVETAFASPAQAPTHASSSPCDWGGCYGPGPFYGPGYFGPFNGAGYLGAGYFGPGNLGPGNLGPGYNGAGTYIRCSTPFNDSAVPASNPTTETTLR